MWSRAGEKSERAGDQRLLDSVCCEQVSELYAERVRSNVCKGVDSIDGPKARQNSTAIRGDLVWTETARASLLRKTRSEFPPTAAFHGAIFFVINP